MEVHTKTDQNPPLGSDFASKMILGDFSKIATNFKTTSLAIKVGSHTIVGTLNNEEYHNSPLCSPFNLFCLYPQQKLKSMEIVWLRRFLYLCTSLFQMWFRHAKFNQVIQVNNKPCDAITHPQLTQEEVAQCVKKLTERFPQHAVVFPRLDELTSPILFESLESNNFYMIPTRMVNIFRPDADYRKKSHSKRDRSLLKKSSYELVEHDEITKQDLERIHELYQMLFIDKHSEENPNLTPKFFNESHPFQWYTFFALRNTEGTIDAFFSYEVEENVMACGPLGYDTSKPQELGLYRMLFAHSLEIAHANHFIFNFGGGNDKFKVNRGSKREVGFTAVYAKHLPLYRRLPWWFLATAGKKVTVKILKRVLF